MMTLKWEDGRGGGGCWNGARWPVLIIYVQCVNETPWWTTVDMLDYMHNRICVCVCGRARARVATPDPSAQGFPLEQNTDSPQRAPSVSSQGCLDFVLDTVQHLMSFITVNTLLLWIVMILSVHVCECANAHMIQRHVCHIMLSLQFIHFIACNKMNK